MSGFLFLIVIDWVMRRETKRRMRGIQWGPNERLEDLDFAYDIVLLSHTQKHIQKKTEDLELYGKGEGLKPNIGKSKVMAMNNRNNTLIQILGTDLQQVEHFTYFGISYGRKRWDRQGHTHCLLTQ